MPAKKMDLDAGLFECRQARRLILDRTGAEAIDDRRESLWVDSPGNLGQTAFGTAKVELRNDQRDVDFRNNATGTNTSIEFPTVNVVQGYSRELTVPGG